MLLTNIELFVTLQVYEVVVNQFMRITYWEYVTNIFLFTLTLYLMYKTKIEIGNDSSDINSSGLCSDNDPSAVERRKLAMAQQQIPYYNYCRRCEAVIPGRDHHCVWLNCCVAKANRGYFLGCITIGGCWIGMIANIFLNSVCYPVSIFSSGLFGWGADGEGSPSSRHHQGLVPVSCPEAYVKTS